MGGGQGHTAPPWNHQAVRGQHWLREFEGPESLDSCVGSTVEGTQLPCSLKCRLSSLPECRHWQTWALEHQAMLHGGQGCCQNGAGRQTQQQGPWATPQTAHRDLPEQAGPHFLRLLHSVVEHDPLELGLPEVSAVEVTAAEDHVGSSEAGWMWAPGSRGGWKATVIEAVTLAKLWGRLGAAPHLSPPSCAAAGLGTRGFALHTCTTWGDTRAVHTATGTAPVCLPR